MCTMPSKEANQAGIPTWDSAKAPEEGRTMLSISATIFMGQNKGSHPALVQYFLYKAKGVPGVNAGGAGVPLATRLAAATAELAKQRRRRRIMEMSRGMTEGIRH